MTASPGSAPKPAPKPSGTTPPTANPAGVGSKDELPPLTKPLADAAGSAADAVSSAAKNVSSAAKDASSAVKDASSAARDAASSAAKRVSEQAAPSTVGKHAAEPTVGQLVTDATNAMSTLVRGEIELAKLELRSTVKNAGTGIGLFLGAAFVLIFSLTFGFIALAEGITALGLHRWLAYLIVFGFQLVLVGLFVFVGIKKVKAVRAPEKTIKTTKETVDYLTSKRG